MLLQNNFGNKFDELSLIYAAYFQHDGYPNNSSKIVKL